MSIPNDRELVRPHVELCYHTEYNDCQNKTEDQDDGEIKNLGENEKMETAAEEVEDIGGGIGISGWLGL